MRLKVDNLKHISDHGLSVEFTDPKLQALIQSLKKDGVTKLTAGQSRITLTTVGRVTFTEAFFSVGSYHKHAVHYMDEAAGLKFSFEEDKNSDALATVKAVVLGGKLPGIWAVAKEQTGRNSYMGQAQDTLRDWSKKFAWTLLGEAGLRAQAVSKKKVDIKTKLDEAKGEAVRLRQSASQMAGRSFDGEVKQKESHLLSYLKGCTRDKHAIIAEKNDVVSGTGRAYRLGVESKSSWDSASQQYKCTGQHVLATTAKMSHPVVTPNYSVTLNADGETVTLSSGIKCEAGVKETLAWLKGEGEAPSTKYGKLKLLEAATSDGKAITLVECGCHRVDLTGLSPEFAAALVPKHTVTGTPGKPRVDREADEPEFLRRMDENLAERLAEIRKRKVDYIALTQREIAAIHYTRDNIGSITAKYEADAVVKDAQAAELEAQLSGDSSRFITGTVEQCNAIVQTAMSALVGHRIN